MRTLEIESPIRPIQQKLRRGASRLVDWGARTRFTDWGMHTELIDLHSGLKTAENLSAEQGLGLVIVIPHFSARDPLETIKEIVIKSPVFNELPILTPIAAHRYHFWHGIFPKHVFGAYMLSVATTDTTRYFEEKHKKPPKTNAGLPEYFDVAAEILSKRGIVVIAPQTGRRETLGEPEAPTMATMVLALRKRKIQNFAMLFVGFELKDTTIYKKGLNDGYNLGKTFITKIGKAYTLAQALQECGELKQFDSWNYKQLAELVSPYYLDPKVWKSDAR